MTLHAGWGHIWKHTVDEIQTNVLQPSQAGNLWGRPYFGANLLNWFGEVTQNCWENYTIFRGNVAKQLLDWPRINHDNSTAYLVLWLYTMEKRKTNAAIVTVSSYASALNRHWKTHTGERPNKCNQCDYATSCADVLKTHLKTHSGKSQTNATNVTMPILGQAISGHIWKRTLGRSQIIAINATLHPCMQAIWGSIR